MECPECSSKLRKCKDGYICVNNHKLSHDSPVYNNLVHFSGLKKRFCPICQTPKVEICMCKCGEMRCINNHVWTSKYYNGDDRYVCETPPDKGHAFNF